MGTENEEETRVVRSMEEGPEYAPDWRHQTVQAYLGQVAASHDPLGLLQDIMWKEKDPFIRQYLRWRYDGRSVNQAAFKYSTGCKIRNAKTGATSMIRAMLIADRTVEEIGTELHTSAQNIVTFAKIFFDIRRYLDTENFLRRVALLDPPAERMTQAEAQRERRWLAAAFHRGWSGVEQVIFQRHTGSPEELDTLTARLQSTLASRALEYALDLETSGIQPSEADLQRFLSARAMPLQSKDTTQQQLLMTTFISGVCKTLEETAEANPDDRSLDDIREITKNQKHQQGAGVTTRRRTRFAGA